MNLKPGIDCAEAAVISLAGKEWFIPLLAVRQNRLIIPRLIKVLPLIEAAKDPATNAFIDVFSESTMDLMNAIVHAALTRAYDISFDEFLDLPINPHDLMKAIPSIVKQTRFFSEGEGVQQAAPGEAQATT